MDTETAVAAPQEQVAPKEKKEKLSKEERIAFEREQLESRLAEGTFDDVRTRVAHILNQHPKTRDSDVELAITYWQRFHRDEVGDSSISFDALRSVTNISSILRARQTIQNTFGLFHASEAVIDFRSDREGKVRRRQRVVANNRPPFVYLYCDESGKNEKHYVVGGFWINDADGQRLKLYETLVAWRKEIEWTSEISFKDMTAGRKDRYVEFVRRALTATEYVGFKAVVLAREDAAKRPTEESIYALYERMVVDGIRHELERGRFKLPRHIIVYKDKDKDGDRIHLNKLKDSLRGNCPRQFDNQVSIDAVLPLDSATNTLMQLADVITGAVSRVINRKDGEERKHKDEAAEEILALLGLDWRKLGGNVNHDFAHIIRL